MNLASWHFLISRDDGPGTTRIWYCFRLIFLTVLIYSSINNCYGQELDDLLQAADEYYEKEQYHSAAQHYQVAVGMQNADPVISYRLAQSYRAIFDYSLAASYYQKTIELDEGTYPMASFYLAQMQKSMGHFKKARDEFEEFISKINKRSTIPKREKDNFLEQAELEIEGCLWAIEQLGKSWTEMGFGVLPEPVNSTSNDYAAVSAGEGRVVTITSGRKGAKGGLVDNRFGEFFTDNFRYRNQEGNWVQENHSDHFDRTNTKFSDGVGTYNVTGDKYYFTSCHEGNAFCKLYVAYRQNGIWKNPELLNNNVNTPGFDNKHPTLTKGGDTLIFVSNRPGGIGGNDLWYSVSKNGEDWGQAKPLPGNINTPFNEASPFYHQNNLLFFSSDGHSGMGGMDIFMARDYKNANSSIQNLGTPFNSGYDDSFFSLTAITGYLSSNRPNVLGKFDIYSFNLPVEKNNLADYLEESADGTQLRSRIRDSNGGNLYSARDEDQFYYDNLSAEERARLERIFNMKEQNQSEFDPSDLPKEDFKYYNRLDIGTKATIERLAQKRMLELDQGSTANQMTSQEKLDWEFYQNVTEDERTIIDRIIDIKVEARRRAILQFSSDEQSYTSNPLNQERIESKLQLRSLSSLAATLNKQQQAGKVKLNTNQNDLPGSGEVTKDKQSHDAYINRRSSEYLGAIETMSLSHQLHYQELAPSNRNDLHQSVLREFILTTSRLSPAEKETLLTQLNLKSDPLSTVVSGKNDEEYVKSVQIRQVLLENMIVLNPSESDLSIRDQVAMELDVQQLLLQRQIEQLEKKESYARNLQGQIKQYIAEQDRAPDPVLEEKIVDEFYAQSQLYLPLLSPKESYYFNSLNPGRQLRIERLVKLVDTQTRDLDAPSNSENSDMVNQLASDQWYYQGLLPEEQELVDALIARGWNPESPYDSHMQSFITSLNESDRSRIDRMMHPGAVALLQIPNPNSQNPTEHQTTNNKPGQSSTISAQHPAPNASRPAPSAQHQAPNAKSQNPTEHQATNNKPGQSSTHSAQHPAPSASRPAPSARAQIFFDIDQFTLRAESKKVLDDLAKFIGNQGKPVQILIEGHTDNIGSSTHNDQLSEHRSLTTAKFLQPSSGLIEIATKSYGERVPNSNNRTAIGRQLNRRVELKIQGIRYESPLKTFLVKPNTTLEMITETTGLLKEDILRWNGPLDEDLDAYQSLRLPIDLDYKSIKHLLYSPKVPQVLDENSNYHIVKPGENLFRLSLKYNTTVGKLESLNNITASELMAGQKIKIR